MKMFSIAILALAGALMTACTTQSKRKPPTPVGQSFVNSIGMEFRLIPPGTFMMGSQDDEMERPVHEVRITNPFYMGVYEVTQSEYESITGQNPSRFKGKSNPVERVSWNDAVEFCAKLTEREQAADLLPSGYEYRLPTEAEWEYACRAGSSGKWCFGDDESKLNEYAWYETNSQGKTHPVGLKRANAWGLHDMHGNVWEWCMDRYGSYSTVGMRDRFDPTSAMHRVGRGGGRDHSACRSRCASRMYYDPNYPLTRMGFRVALARSTHESGEETMDQ